MVELPGLGTTPSSLGPGPSSLTAALRDRKDTGSPGTSVQTIRAASPAILPDKPVKSNYGSFDNRSVSGSPAGTYEDPEVVRRHLVQGANNVGRYGSSLRSVQGPIAQDDEFSSLQLQGGDVTRPIYRWAEDSEGGTQRSRKQRSRSFNVTRPEPESEVVDINAIKIPGGFRRHFIRKAADSPSPSGRGTTVYDDGPSSAGRAPNPKLLTNNFLEFLTLYGHFAGEELEEDDEVLEPDEYFEEAWEDHIDYGDQGSDGEPLEDSALLGPGTPGKRRRKHKERQTGTTTSWGAALLLLKSFVGTGVLFLPKAYLNGGMLFSNLVLLGVAILSFYCFILLVNARLKVDGSFGDIGGALYGKYMRAVILTSIVISQMGFVAAYIVFVSENLQAFVLAVSKCKSFIDIKFMVLLQLVVFLPLSLVRDISKLGFTALVADFFILLGLIYLYYYDIATIVEEGIADIAAFNSSTWTLFIGTAIFTFEGVGLIIPIQESMKQPKRFPGVLAMVMIGITIVFMSMGALSYAAYGSSTKTVVLLNLPQQNKFVNAVQFLYSLAILLSTPLQLFPAIRILENEWFTRSGKYNRYIKWKKNVFRFCLVILCAVIALVGAGDLDKFVALVGSFACVPLVYIYPPMLHLKACASSRRQQIMDIALCIFGAIGCVYTTALTISTWINETGSKPPGYCDTK
ncbi:putative amino acid permease [Phaeomoniella chlamydospora]|uniref:Putative amino acid permease n=1 Tax=Phaeomoniella chlamydospora TaxID=158046 RepID=A0A0G2H136_PHACM|nr:putative amino acid permease [Phaeomoniella chlamydospora]